MFRKLSYSFSAGVAGGIASALVIWLFGVAGINAALGVSIAPDLTRSFIYSRIVWGGLWGFLFLVPIMKRSLYSRGLILSIIPSAIMLFVAYPAMKKGVYGLSLGTLTPVLTIFFNAIWGTIASLWYRYCGE
ncbi:MAG: hypothetical protein JSV21_09760 [Nitrospirota bacterium]|nr:MAG: hypothetical protein JSV21_09760 [Nitrospirota bacterium]